MNSNLVTLTAPEEVHITVEVERVLKPAKRIKENGKSVDYPPVVERREETRVVWVVQSDSLGVLERHEFSTEVEANTFYNSNK